MIYSLMDACREDMPQYANKLAFQFQSLLKDDYEATRREHQLFSPLATRLVEMLSTVAESYSITRVLEEGDGTLLTALAKIGHCLTGQGILEPERPLIEHMRGMGFKPERMVALLQQNKSWQVAVCRAHALVGCLHRRHACGGGPLLAASAQDRPRCGGQG